MPLTRLVNRMDCTEFRQMILGDPTTAEGEAHLESCADCQAYLGAVTALDSAIRDAMSVDVPELSMPELPQIESANVVSLAERNGSSYHDGCGVRCLHIHVIDRLCVAR